MRPEHADDALAHLAQWRAQGAERRDPAGFARIAALAARAQGHAGATRGVLDARVAQLIADYAAQLEQGAGSAQAGGAQSSAEASLASLLAQLADARAATAGDAAAHAAYPELPVLAQFRQLWSSLRTASQLRQSLQPLPADAGPLNSAVLVQRAIARMRELSPGYLQHFLAYVDALAWMERLQGERALPAPENTRGAPAKKPATRSRSKRRAE